MASCDTTLFVFNVPPDVDIDRRLTEQLEQVVDGYSNEHRVEWKKHGGNVSSLSLSTPVKLLKDEFTVYGLQLHAHLLPSELVESMSVSMSKQWTDKLKKSKIVGLLEPGVKTVTNCGVVTLEGNKNSVLKSVEKIRDAIIDTMFCPIDDNPQSTGSSGQLQPNAHSNNSIITEKEQSTSNDDHEAIALSKLPEHRSRVDAIPSQDSQPTSGTMRKNGGPSYFDKGDRTPLEDDEVDEMATLVEWVHDAARECVAHRPVGEPVGNSMTRIGENGLAENILYSRSGRNSDCNVPGGDAAHSATSRRVPACTLDESRFAGVTKAIIDDQSLDETSSVNGEDRPGVGHNDEILTRLITDNNTTSELDKDLIDFMSDCKTTAETPGEQINETSRKIVGSSESPKNTVNEPKPSPWGSDGTDIVLIGDESQKLVDLEPLGKQHKETVLDAVPSSRGTCDTDRQEPGRRGDTPLTTTNAGEEFEMVDHEGDSQNLVDLTSQNDHPMETSHWQIDEPLWEFIKFSYADKKWENVLKAVGLNDGSGKVELSGNAEDVDRLKKFCREGRLNRTIITQMFPVPSGHSSEALKPLARQLGNNKVLVRSTNDPGYLELTGRIKDVQNIVCSIEKIHPRSKSPPENPHAENPPCPDKGHVSGGLAPKSGSGPASQLYYTGPNNDRFEHFTPKTYMKVTVVSGNILSQGCEAIVCPTNQAMDNSGGLARAIASAAGCGLRRECKDFIGRNGPLSIGMVTDTQAGNIPPPTKRVIHIRGPSIDDYRDINECCRMLEATFWNCLKQANFSLRVSSVALPAISSGALGVPRNVVATAACLALVKFDETMASKSLTERHLKEIKFVNINPDVTSCMVATFREMLTPQQIHAQGGKVFDEKSRSPRGQRKLKQQTDGSSCAVSTQNDGTDSAPKYRDTNASNSDSLKPSDSTASSCPICMDDIDRPETLGCGHVFCADCIAQAFAHQKKCPCCGKIFGQLKGDQPEGGKMEVQRSNADLPGYRGCGRIVITYVIPDGEQKANHPNPGMPYKGAFRVAYLPDNAEGREICSLLRRAFDASLIFTVGRSTTSGQEDVVTWNDIHHKTKPSGTSFGYPDPSYLSRVRDELAAKGIVSPTSASDTSSVSSSSASVMQNSRSADSRQIRSSADNTPSCQSSHQPADKGDTNAFHAHYNSSCAPSCTPSGTHSIYPSLEPFRDQYHLEYVLNTSLATCK